MTQKELTELLERGRKYPPEVQELIHWGWKFGGMISASIDNNAFPTEGDPYELFSKFTQALAECDGK